VAARRLATTERNQMGFHLAVGLAHIGPLGLLLVQCRVQSDLHKAPLDPINLLHADGQRLGDLLIGQMTLLERTLIAAQQNQGVEHLLAAVFPSRRYLLQQLTFFPVQCHLVPDERHGTSPSWPGRSIRYILRHFKIDLTLVS